MALIFLRSCHLLSKASPSPSHGYSSTLPFPLLSPHHLGGLVTRAGPDPIILWGSLLHMQIQIPSLSGNGSLLHMQIRIPSFSGGACYRCKSGSHHSQGSLLHVQIRIPLFSEGVCYMCRSRSHHSQEMGASSDS